MRILSHQPVALLPDKTLSVLLGLRLPRELARRVREEWRLRAGSDRSGRRLPIEPGDWLMVQMERLQ